MGKSTPTYQLICNGDPGEAGDTMERHLGTQTDRQVILNVVWFGFNYQIDKNWKKVVKSATSLTPKWAERKLFD